MDGKDQGFLQAPPQSLHAPPHDPALRRSRGVVQTMAFVGQARMQSPQRMHSGELGPLVGSRPRLQARLHAPQCTQADSSSRNRYKIGRAHV